MRRSLLRAWEELWKRTQFLRSSEPSYYEKPNTPAEQQLADALKELSEMRLPVAAVDWIAEALDAARKIGNERECTISNGW